MLYGISADRKLREKQAKAHTTPPGVSSPNYSTTPEQSAALTLDIS